MNTATIQQDAICKCGHAARLHHHGKSCTEIIDGMMRYCKCELFRELGSKIEDEKEGDVMKKKAGVKREPMGPKLAPFVDKQFKIHIEIDGKEREATVLSSGMIRYKEKDFTSPCAAATHIAKEIGVPGVNGWTRFRYDKDGVMTPLDQIRGSKAVYKFAPKTKAAKTAKAKVAKTAKPKARKVRTKKARPATKPAEKPAEKQAEAAA